MRYTIQQRTDRFQRDHVMKASNNAGTSYPVLLDVAWTTRGARRHVCWPIHERYTVREVLCLRVLQVE